MRRSPVPWLITIFAIIALAIGWRIFADTERTRYLATQRVVKSPSLIRIEYQIRDLKGSVREEHFRYINDNGSSSVVTELQNPKGTLARFSLAVHTYDVSFLFEKLVQDGVWELGNRPMRSNGGPVYTVAIYQLVNGKSGSHHFTFDDPGYWARAREFHIDLGKGAPSQSDLLKLASAGKGEPRYQKIVDDFAAFAPPEFRATVKKAREQLART